MEWYSGGVVNAIAECRSNTALFIVFMYDDSSASAKTTESWNSDTVHEVLSANKSVAIQISKGSVEQEQFSQLYVDPVFVYPSIFCIGLTGKTLLIMNGQQSAVQIKEKLSEAFEKLNHELQSQATPTQPETPPTQVETPPTQPETPPTQPETPPTQPRDDPPASEASTASQPPSSSEQSVPLTPTSQNPDPPSEGSGAEGGVQGRVADRKETKEEKIKRAEQLIKQKRQEREEAEFKRQKSAELKRREEGKQMAGSQKDLEDLRKQTWIQERKKAKEEERKAKEAIREKLRQDQMEREAQRRAREQTASELRQRPPAREQTASELRQRPSPSPSQASHSHSRSSNATGVCRIQLRLPSGEKSVLEMKTDDQLLTLRKRVSEEVGVAAEDVVLSSTYPIRELTEDMDGESLVQLRLASGVVAVRFKGGSMGVRGKGHTSGWSLWGIIVGLFQLLMSLVTLVKRFCGCGDDADQDRSHPVGGASRGGGGYGVRGERVRKFRPGDYEDNSSDDDEERRNTYNGNSTEQQ